MKTAFALILAAAASLAVIAVLTVTVLMPIAQCPCNHQEIAVCGFCEGKTGKEQLNCPYCKGRRSDCQKTGHEQ